MMLLEILDDDGRLRNGFGRCVVVQDRNLADRPQRANAAASLSSPQIDETDWNGVSFSYSAIRTFWQNEASGWKCSVSDMPK